MSRPRKVATARSWAATTPRTWPVTIEPTWMRAMAEVDTSRRFIFQSAVPNRSQPFRNGSEARM
jgi:hypothetical protein